MLLQCRGPKKPTVASEKVFRRFSIRGVTEMSILAAHVVRALSQVHDTLTEDQAQSRFRSRYERQPRALRCCRHATRDTIATLWRQLCLMGPGSLHEQDTLADAETLCSAERYAANVENMAGTVKVPLGVIGPLRINGLHAWG